jgi:hypothetical protein
MPKFTRNWPINIRDVGNFVCVLFTNCLKADYDLTFTEYPSFTEQMEEFTVFDLNREAGSTVCNEIF